MICRFAITDISETSYCSKFQPENESFLVNGAKRSFTNSDIVDRILIIGAPSVAFASAGLAWTPSDRLKLIRPPSGCVGSKFVN